MTLSRRSAILAAAAWLCGSPGRGAAQPGPEPPSSEPPSSEPPSSEPPSSKPFVLVMLGDSLTSGFGLPKDEALPAALERTLRAQGAPVKVVNAGVAGDTSRGGLARFEWSVGDGADAVLVALGGNDLLRGIDPALTRANLEAILAKAEAADLPVMLAGMRAPANWGEDYRAAFDAIYADLAAAQGEALYPFLLDGVAGQAALNQPDGVHPNAAGVAVIVQGLGPAVAAFIAEASAAR